MSLWPAFVGSTYQALSPSMAAETAINIYAETRQVPGSPKQVTFYGTPGRVSEATVTGDRCRGWFTQDGRTWVTVGDTLYERTSAGGYTSRGTIADNGEPVSYATNGKGGDQLGIVGGDTLYVLDLNTNALSTVALPFVGPVMMAFIDGYGLINQRDSPIVWFSALEDFTSWNALDFFTRSETSDNAIGIAVTRSRVWVLGSKTTTQFYDSGDTDTPFLPYQGTTMQVGLASPWLLQVYSDMLVWVAAIANGLPKVVMATEPTAQTISTPPIELMLGRCSTVATGTSWVYEQEGHIHYGMTFPDCPDDVKTYVFDLSEKLWHARAEWDIEHGRYTAYAVAGATMAGNTVLVGSSDSGVLSELSLSAYDDAGQMIRRERACPYVGAENQWLFLDQFELGMQPGVGLVTGQGSEPLVNLDVSRDGARTWVSAGTAALGPMGDYLARAIWRRLGRARSDRLVLRVTQTDPVKCVWGPGAWLRVTPGSGQL